MRLENKAVTIGVTVIGGLSRSFYPWKRPLPAFTCHVFVRVSN